MKASIREKLENIIRIPEDLKNYKDILKLDIKYFKNIDPRIARILQAVLGVSKIGDFAKKVIDDSKILTLKVLGINPTELNVWVFVSRVITEEKVDELIGPRKFSIVGLDNAGKTAILRILQNRLNLDIFGKLPATIGVNRAQLTKKGYGLAYNVLDMGGQDEYRKGYIQNAEKYFVGVDYLMYVIDIQDPEHFEASFEYFREVLEVLELLKEKPEILIVINKVDPDIRDDKEIEERCEFLSDEFKKIMIIKDFKYEISRYSIYNTLGDNQAIIKGIKDFILGRAGKKVPETELGGTLEQVLTIIINLASTIESRFQRLEQSNQNIIEWIDYLKESIPKVEPEIVKEIKDEKLSKLEKEKEVLRKTLYDDLKSIMKLREKDIS